MLTPREQALLDALRKEAEGCDDGGWKDVYLDNITLRTTSPRVFAGLTGSLAKKGLYREEDGDAWGMVRIQG